MTRHSFDEPVTLAELIGDCAVAWAAFGYHILPICPGLKNPPKRERLGLPPDRTADDPRTVFDVASCNPHQVGEWFASDFQGYNMGLSLVKSGIIDIAPDCPEREQEFQRLGLPAGHLAFASGSGHGWHHLFRAPADLAPAKINNLEYDILYSKGVCVLPPSLHASGRRYCLLSPFVYASDLPLCPAWAVDMLREKPASEWSEAPPIPCIDFSEPPVPLRSHPLKLWRGEIFSKRPDGSIRRGATHWRIAKDLIKHGCPLETVAAALKDRNEKLGHFKEVGDDYYWNTMMKAAADVLTEWQADRHLRAPFPWADSD